MGMFWLIMLLWPLIATSSDRTGCLDKCGDVSVPYPFGINESRCAMSEAFKLICNHNDTTTELILGKNIPVRNISVEEGTITVGIMRAYDCYNETGSTASRHKFWITLGNESRPFRFSDTRNKLTGFGCDTMAFMTDRGGNFGSGCISMCNESPVNITQGSSCSGIGCCQISVPKSLKTLNVTIDNLTNRSNIWRFNPCVYAFVADERSFNVSDLSLKDYPDKLGDSNVVIEWVVKEEKCEEAQASEYACHDNTDCTYSENGNGYRCKCKEGFIGNPYLPQGCQDIDECEDRQTYRCEGTCKNTIGNYTCRCPLGMHGDGKVGCQGFRITTIVSVVGAIISGMIISLLIFITCKWRIKEKNFIENGGKLLNHQRVRIFSEAELVKATNNYDKGHFLGEGGFGSVYRGVLADNTQVAVKKPKELNKNQLNQEFQHEIDIVSQVNHKNVVKLLGLCLETKVPLMVYEFISNGTLFQHIHDKKSSILKSWKNRLRIAAETALALDYLHSLADPPIIHRDVKSMNILLDDNYTAKVSDFGASVLISPGQTRLETKLQGTLGYLDPEYLMTCNLTEKSDVYSFGVVLVELLTGEKPSSGERSGEKGNIIQCFILAMENNDLSQILGFEVADEGEMEEVAVVAELANRCVNRSGLKRPTMKEVAEELARLKRLHENLWAQQNSEETEHLLGELSYSYPESSPAQKGQTNMHSAISFEIENYSYSS